MISVLTSRKIRSINILFPSVLGFIKQVQGKTLPQFTQDDSITCILDMDARTLSFAKNDEQPVLAFEDLPTGIELYPCVTFYSSSPGEKVRITSMVMQGAQRDFGKFIVLFSRIVFRLFPLRQVFRL